MWDALDWWLVAARLAVGAWLLWSLPRLGPPGAGRPDPSSGLDLTEVAVVIPARDEARQLPGLLGSIPAGPDVVVVDDHSRDATADVARAHGARVISSRPLPDAWTGKAWACHQGTAATTADVVLFVDADVRFGPAAVERVLGVHATQGGLVSVQPHHHPGSAVEHLAALCNVVAVAGTDAASPVGRVAGARGAFGPVLATTRADLDRVGGHEAIRSSVVDDVALAERYRSVGLPVAIRGGGEHVWFRMYPEGFRQLLEGFTKNLAAGAGAVRRSTLALVVAWLTLLVQGAAAPVLAAFAGSADAASDAVVLYLLVAAQVTWMAAKVGRFGLRTGLAFPLPTAFFLVVFVRSAVAAARGSVSWRGRRVPTRRTRP